MGNELLYTIVKMYLLPYITPNSNPFCKSLLNLIMSSGFSPSKFCDHVKSLLLSVPSQNVNPSDRIGKHLTALWGPHSYYQLCCLSAGWDPCTRHLEMSGYDCPFLRNICNIK